MTNRVDHTCVAEHCVACCPTAQGYSSGFADAKSFYHTENQMRLMDVPFTVTTLVTTAILAVVLVFIVRNLQRRVESVESTNEDH